MSKRAYIEAQRSALAIALVDLHAARGDLERQMEHVRLLSSRLDTAADDVVSIGETGELIGIWEPARDATLLDASGLHDPIPHGFDFNLFNGEALTFDIHALTDEIVVVRLDYALPPRGSGLRFRVTLPDDRAAPIDATVLVVEGEEGNVAQVRRQLRERTGAWTRVEPGKLGTVVQIGLAAGSSGVMFAAVRMSVREDWHDYARSFWVLCDVLVAVEAIEKR